MEHKIDKNTIWFDTGQIVVSRKYIKKLFVEHKKGVFGTRVVEGPPIYFDELNQSQLALVNIMLTAQDALFNELNCSELRGHTLRNNYGEVTHSNIKKMKGPTEKQLYYIEFIEHQTNIKFTGKTRKEASKYINENKSKIFHDNYEDD